MLQPAASSWIAALRSHPGGRFHGGSDCYAASASAAGSSSTGPPSLGVEGRFRAGGAAQRARPPPTRSRRGRRRGSRRSAPSADRLRRPAATRSARRRGWRGAPARARRRAGTRCSRRPRRGRPGSARRRSSPRAARVERHPGLMPSRIMLGSNVDRESPHGTCTNAMLLPSGSVTVALRPPPSGTGSPLRCPGRQAARASRRGRPRAKPSAPIPPAPGRAPHMIHARSRTCHSTSRPSMATKSGALPRSRVQNSAAGWKAATGIPVITSLPMTRCYFACAGGRCSEAICDPLLRAIGSTDGTLDSDAVRVQPL
jgi:hypothetical protein